MESMLMDPTQLFLAIFSSIVGFGYMAYGRKNNFFFLIAGICLVGASFFTFDTVTYVLICVGLVVAPFLLTRLL